jgi:hypothetical protein
MNEKNMIGVALSEAPKVPVLLQHRKLKVLMDSHAKLFKLLMIQKYFELSTQLQPQVWFSKSVNIKGSSVDEAMGILSESIGTAHYPFNSMLSCATNMKEITVSDKLVTYVCKPIKAGSEIFRSAQRKAKRPFLECKCACEACVNDWPTTVRMRRSDPSFQYSDVRAFAPNNQVKKNIGRNNAYIDRHFKEHEPTQEVYVSFINHKELSRLARPSFYA